MRRTSLALAAAVAIGLGGCDQPHREIMAPQNPRSIRLAAPDATFHLTESERAQLRPGFDADALESLLAHVRPEVRPTILSSFVQPPPGEPAGVLVKMGDPALQPLLDAVWAPMWELMPRDAIDREDKDFPGRELARQRRATGRHSDPK